jgi:uncharacterized damage-inducible protein DinB
MIDGAYVVRMARYDRWQNENLYSAADRLSDTERRCERDVTQPHWVLVPNPFTRRTHHRGQVHCMLTRAGERASHTDLPIMPE